MATNQHVTPKSDGTWNVIGAVNTKATKNFDKQADAIKLATQIAKNQKTELFLHGKDGRIRERNSYGNDPHPPKG